jgi:drug/metabolite transporter (DMT)-like permease
MSAVEVVHVSAMHVRVIVVGHMGMQRAVRNQHETEAHNPAEDEARQPMHGGAQCTRNSHGGKLRAPQIPDTSEAPPTEWAQSCAESRTYLYTAEEVRTSHDTSMSRFFSLQRHAIYVLAAAALFGASAPIAKMLLERMSPVTLAALTYCGGGVALMFAWLIRRLRSNMGLHDAPATSGPWRRAEVLSMTGAIVAGGVLAPTILFWSLSRLPAGNAALLLNFEGLLTAVLAAAFFHEAVDRRVWLAMIVMIIAGGVLSAAGSTAGLAVIPALGVILACALWALDNNLTRAVSHRDALGIAALKCVVAGSTNAGIAWALGANFAVTTPTLLAGLTLGALSYGLSLVLFVSALSHLGSARTAAHFGTAPFFGAALAVLLLSEPVTVSLAVAIVLTALSTWLVLTERHFHMHTHEPIEHEHLHAHDEHHLHEHAGDEGPAPHRHRHKHEPLAHSHEHLPDLHHRHGHD